MLRWEKILVPVDFSPCARRALEQALAIAHLTDGAVEVLHVVWSAGIETAGATWHEAELRARDEAEERLDDWLDAIPGAELLRREVVLGEPSAAIVERAAGYDAVVMGTHGRTGLARALLGSVAERVVRLAPCPVVTLREVAAARSDARDASGKEMRP